MNNTCTQRRSLRSVSALAAFGIAAGALAGPGIALTTLAAPVAVAQTASTIDPVTEGAITVTKLNALDGQAGTTSTGTPLADLPSGTEVLQGAEFTLYNITEYTPTYLSTNEGLTSAAGVTADQFALPADGSAPAGTTRVDTLTTDTNGVATFSNLPVGLYLLVETNAPEGFSGAAPAIVQVPMTLDNAEGTGEWTYNVSVYPKNEEFGFTKTVDDTNKVAGDVMSYTITSDIPRLSTATSAVDVYRIVDPLPAGILTTTPGDVTVAGYVAGTDYTVTVSPEQEVTIEFTPVGMEKLTAAKRANADAQVVTTINATVLVTNDTNQGLASNVARVTYSTTDTPDDTTTGNEDNPVRTQFVRINLDKVAVSSPTTKLAGATFELYRSVDNDTCESSDITEDNKLTVNNVSEWTTDSNGAAVIEGLTVAAQDTAYCLLETKAPAGYSLMAEPYLLTFDGANYQHTATIENVTNGAERLPLTGGAGIAGLAVIAGLGAAGAVASRVKRSK